MFPVEQATPTLTANEVETLRGDITEVVQINNEVDDGAGTSSMIIHSDDDQHDPISTSDGSNWITDLIQEVGEDLPVPPLETSVDESWKSTLLPHERMIPDGADHKYNTRYKERRLRSKIFNISVKKALNIMPKDAIKSIYKELYQLHNKKVFQGVLPGMKSVKKTIKSFMFLKEKYTSTGEFDKLKARLVAGGHMQDRSEMLYEDISSPTAHLSHLFIIAVIAARDNRYVKTLDIGGAFLNANMAHRDVYVELDSLMAAFLVNVDATYRQYLRSDGTMVVKLLKALYGCIESSKLWYDLLSSILISDDFFKNPLDPCIFNKMVDGDQVTVVIYVDDLFLTSKNENALNDVIQLLTKRFGDVKVHEGMIHSYLGMTFDFSTSKFVKITMEGYIKDLLEDISISDTVTTPATENLFITRETEFLNEISAKRFHTLTAKLLYLAKRVRPDILLAVSFLSTRVLHPDIDDEAKLFRILRYLNGSRELGIILEAQFPAITKAFIDAAYGIHSNGMSHSGLAITLGGGPIATKSTKQRNVTKSSTEAELVAESDFASDAIASKNFLEAQGETTGPAIIFQDNKSTMAMIKNGYSKSDRTRHINIRYYWTKEKVDAGEISIEYIPTDEMVADILTKPLQGAKFLHLRQMFLNWKM